MKLKVAIAPFLSIVCLIGASSDARCSSLENKKAESNLGENFKEQFSETKPGIPYSRGTSCFLVEQSWPRALNRVESILEPSNLSNSSIVNIRIQTGQDFPNWKVSSFRGNKSDKFYCEQALAEAWPYHVTPDFTGQFQLGKNCAHASNQSSENVFFKNFPKLDKRRYVVIHVIPRSVLWRDRFAGTFTEEELASKANLRAIPIELIDSNWLIEYRKAWASFLSRDRATRTEILDYAATLLDRYKDLFKVGS